MTHYKKSFFVSLFFALFTSVLTPIPSYAEIDSMASAINKAGRQRMLTQRIVKAYCQIGLGVRTDEARVQLDKAILLFDIQLTELLNYVTGDATRAELIKVAQLWKPFKQTAQGPVNREGAEQLMTMSDELLQAAHKSVLRLQDASGVPQARLVNVAGRQRMLSQRVAKLYMLRKWEFKTSMIADELQQAENEFKGALIDLKNAPENSDEINAALHKAETQWSLFEYALHNQKEDLSIFVALGSEKILKIMNDITGMYENLERPDS